MTESDIDLSIVIPAYKEADRIGKSLEKIADFLSDYPERTVEILVVSNCPDETAQEAAKKADLFEHFKVVDEKDRMGKGGAVRLGMYEGEGRYKLFMDTDLSTPLHHLKQVFKLIDENVEVAIGVRDLVKIHKGFLRKTVTKLANLGAQILVVPGIKDTQCGFKLFRGDVAKEVFGRQTITEWSFDVELLAISRKLGYEIEFMDIPDWNDPKTVGLVGDNPIKIVFDEALNLFKIRWKLWTGVYKEINYQHQPATVNYCELT